MIKLLSIAFSAFLVICSSVGFSKTTLYAKTINVQGYEVNYSTRSYKGTESTPRNTANEISTNTQTKKNVYDEPEFNSKKQEDIEYNKFLNITIIIVSIAIVISFLTGGS